MDWIRQNWKSLLNQATSLATVAGLVVVIIQLHQADEHQRWSNYNELNIHYSNWLSNKPKEISMDCFKPYSELSSKSKIWIRFYFDLYSEEHHLYLNGLIPEDMWEDRIDNGVTVNLVTFPVLVDGYLFWKENQAFQNPAEFIPFVDKKISSINSQIETAIAKLPTC